MSGSTTAIAAPGTGLWKMVAASPLDWISLGVGLYRFLRRVITREAHEGMYHILSYTSTLELLDPKGETAVFKKHQRVKFLQDHVLAFQDYAWGDGEIFADYSCRPGEVTDVYQEGDRYNILISLRETKAAGDIEDFYINRTVIDGFTKDQESSQIEIRHKTKRLRLEVIFPPGRPCRRAMLVERSRNRTTVLNQDHFNDLPDGRQSVAWETTTIRRFEIYTLTWTW